MKQQIISVSFIFLINCFINSPMLAQRADKALEKTIVVKGKQITIDSLLRIFSGQTTIGFSFNSKKISPARKVAVPKNSLTIFQWLQNLKQEVNIEYKLVGNHLVLLDRPVKIKNMKTSAVLTGTNSGNRNKPLSPVNKMHNSKVQNNYSAVHNPKIFQTAQKNNVTPIETGKKDADTSAIKRKPPVEDSILKKENTAYHKIIINDTTQPQVVQKINNPLPEKFSSSDTTASWDYKHHLTLTPGKPILESGKYYEFSIGLDYDRKLLSFGNTVNKNNAAWKRFNLNLELGADYVFDKDSTQFGGFFIGHIFPDLIYKFGQYAHIDLGAGLAVQLPSPAAHLGYGVNLSLNFPVTRQKVMNGSGNASSKIILFGAGIEMYEFWPFDAIFLGTLRVTMLFPGKKR